MEIVMKRHFSQFNPGESASLIMGLSHEVNGDKVFPSESIVGELQDGLPSSERGDCDVHCGFNPTQIIRGFHEQGILVAKYSLLVAKICFKAYNFRREPVSSRTRKTTSPQGSCN